MSNRTNKISISRSPYFAQRRIQLFENNFPFPAQIQELQEKSPYDTYQTSLTSRYCSHEMTKLFSQRSRHSIWRKLWLGLAEAEASLGIDIITPQALEEMRAHLILTDKDFEIARIEEKKRRHASPSFWEPKQTPFANTAYYRMSWRCHVHAFGAVAPAAAGIIHYGATSCYVTDNAELIIMRDALDVLIKKLAKVIHNLKNFSNQWKADMQLSQHWLTPTSKALSQSPLDVADLMFDLEALEAVRRGLKFRGAQGTTGTQASFLEM
ncbi:hypothetical protein C2857_000138 [Epichloe festucae Fl1]|uniref:Adenylosuccinate lyase n=1 Tax=Epichloe festucae (strain Fl1) TaxID=877507 RepID=A0A7S9KTX8_EPIFF|nr:hypothetical protein C2857_000138 [Epichloe festucae Fl1]